MNIPDETIAAIQAEAAKSAPQPTGEAAPPPEPPKPTPTPPVANGKPPEAHKTATPTPTPAPTPPKDPPKSDKEENLANLRKKLEAREAEFAALQNSVTATSKEKADADLKRADAEAKLQAALEREEKDYKPRVERLKVVEQELQKREEVLKVKAYQETPEFHERFVKPLVDAQVEAQELLTELVVDNGDGTVRAATMDDFNEVLSARSVNEAYAIAQKKFGPVAQTAVNLRQRIRTLERSRSEATKRAGEMALEYEQRRQSEFVQQQQQFKNSVYTEAERLLKERLQIDDTDPEEKDAFTSATQFADGLWNSDGESVDQVVKKAAKARANNIEAPVLRKKLDRAMKENAELKEQLKQYQKSDPPLEPRGSSGAPAVTQVGDKPERAQLMKAAQDAIATGR